MKLNEEELYNYLKEANSAIDYLLTEIEEHNNVLYALCEVVLNHSRFNKIVGSLFGDITKEAK